MILPNRHLPSLVNNAGQLEQDVHLERRHLAHHLGRVEQLVLRDRLHSVAIGGIQVDALDQLHVIQQRIKGHKVGVANLVSLRYL